MSDSSGQFSSDVIVVGAGGSGLAAGLRAVECGASVLLLEKQPQPGGTTGIAVGSFTGNRTSLQRAAGVTDSVKAHIQDAARFAPPDIEARNHAALRAFFLKETAATFEWLRGHGLHFQGPNPEPPNRVPRMHNVIPGAKAYIAALQAAFIRRGGRMLCQVAVDELSKTDGRVTGVVARVHGTSRQFTARRAVILAAGDYANSATMIAQYRGKRFADIEGINPHAGGDGHRMAQAAGASLLNMDVTYGPELRFVAPPGPSFQQLLPTRGLWPGVLSHLLPWIPQVLLQPFIKRLLVTWQHPENALFEDGAILVNAHGERFCQETQWPDREIAVASQPGKSAYILLDERLIDRYSAWPHFISTAPRIAYAYVQDYLRLRPDIAMTAPTLDELARRGGLDATVLQRQVRDRNESLTKARRGEIPNGPELWEGKRWALLGPLKAYFTTTEGGVAIDETLQVLDASQKRIPGLFAVGQNGLGGQILWGHGLHIAWALTSGRLAGEHAAQSRSVSQSL